MLRQSLALTLIMLGLIDLDPAVVGSPRLSPSAEAIGCTELPAVK
mgnify:CR=1 FL=1